MLLGSLTVAFKVEDEVNLADLSRLSELLYYKSTLFYMSTNEAIQFDNTDRFFFSWLVIK